jgi:hypothetical protein
MKGNGGWGRILFELIDAKGRVWTPCGNQYAGASNSSDNKATSWVSFEGWNTITMPLPGQYPGDDQFVHRPHKFDWWPSNSPEAIEIEKTYQESLKNYEVALKEHEKVMQEYEAEKAKALKEKKRPPRAPKAPRKPRKPHPGHEPVDYPIKLTKVIVTIRPHIFYVNEERPVKNRAVYLDSLGVHGE